MTAGTAGNQPGGGRRALSPHRKVFFLVQGYDIFPFLNQYN